MLSCPLIKLTCDYIGKKKSIASHYGSRRLRDFVVLLWRELKSMPIKVKMPVNNVKKFQK